MRPMLLTVRLTVSVLLLCAMFTTDPAARQKAEPTAAPAADPSLVDLTRAAVVTPGSLNVQERTAIRVLVEEIEKRTTVRLPVSAQWPADTVAVIAVGPLGTSTNWAGAGLRGAPAAGTPGREGYPVAVNASGRRAPTVLLLGASSRGVRFRGGRLLR